MIETEKLISVMREVQGQLDTVMRTGCYGLGFLFDIAVAASQRHYNTQCIVDEIAGLEGCGRIPSATKPESPFQRPLLNGYWHKHHSQARFLARNGLEELKRSGVVEGFIREHEGQDFTPELAGQLALEIVVGNYLKWHAERRMTGEWIVFAKHENRNKYILLACHDDGDANTAARIQAYEELDRSRGWSWESHSIVLSDPELAA